MDLLILGVLISFGVLEDLDIILVIVFILIWY